MCRNRISIKSKHLSPLVFEGKAPPAPARSFSEGETLDGKRKERKNPPLLSCYTVHCTLSLCVQGQ